MTFSVIKQNSDLLLIYTPRDGVEWIDEYWQDDVSELHLKHTFYFKKDHCIDYNSSNITSSRMFVIGKLNSNGYYEIDKSVFHLKHEFYIANDIDITSNMFLTEIGYVPVFAKIDKLVNSSVYIGGNNENAIPMKDFELLLDEFPTKTELDYYAASRIENILGEYLNFQTDSRAKLERYVAKRKKISAAAEISSIEEFEIQKYEFIRDRVKEMLQEPDAYSEKDWEQKILEFILLLYPKYVQVLNSIPVYDFYTNPAKKVEREIDLVLLDTNGNMDIIEIKKPFPSCILSANKYRDNYVPKKELSGAIVQAEKYIFHLNKWGVEGEKKLNEKYKEQLPDGLKINIVNPKAMLILGRSKDFDEQQKFDFEIIRRKYVNIMDILTYDDLLARLDRIIDKFKNKTSGGEE